MNAIHPNASSPTPTAKPDASFAEKRSGKFPTSISLRRKNKRRWTKRTPVGSAPGTLKIAKDATPTRIRHHRYSPAFCRDHDGLDFADLPSPEPGAVDWFDVVGLGDQAAIEAIAKHFHLHALAIEDVVDTHQRPKFEDFDDYLYIVVRMPSVSEDLDLEQVSVFIGPTWVLTWQEREGDCFGSVRKRLKNSRRTIRKQAAPFLAYAIIDAIVDSYFPVLRRYSDMIDAVEDELTSHRPPRGVINRLHAIRTDIRSLRRAVSGHRDMVRSMMSYEGELLDDSSRLHMRDVADHILQLVELLESGRDSCSDLQDLHLALAGMRMNEVMKVLTIIATIFIPLGFLAGIYGMNFDTASPYNLPELSLRYGYPLLLGAMGLVAATMLVFFYRKGWLTE